MRIKLPYSALLVTYLFFLLPSCVMSQGYGPVDEAAAGNFFIVGARALSMGGAYIAVATDATALVYNPAGLARVTRIEFSGGMTHQRYSSRTQLGAYPQFEGNPQNNTRFSSANVVFPVPTYRGSLVLALGVNRVRSFDRTMQLYVDDPQESRMGMESESGSLYIWSFGGAIDVSPNVSVGGAINLWSGKGSYSWLFDRSPGDMLKFDDTIKDDYSGFNAKFGFRIQPNRHLVFGGTIDSPVTYTIEEDVNQVTVEDGVSDTEFWSSEYKVSLPFSMGAGMALYVDNLTLAGDINYTDWTQMEYKRLDELAEANRKIKETYTDALRFHLGAEYLFPQISTSLRAGFYHDPLPYKSKWVEKNRNFFTTGIGFLIDQVMIFDIALAHGSWEVKGFTNDLTEKYTATRIFVSVAYRL
jgi:long-subunit fatty acid transport protein